MEMYVNEMGVDFDEEEVAVEFVAIGALLVDFEGNECRFFWLEKKLISGRLEGGESF